MDGKLQEVLTECEKFIDDERFYSMSATRVPTVIKLLERLVEAVKEDQRHRGLPTKSLVCDEAAACHRSERDAIFGEN